MTWLAAVRLRATPPGGVGVAVGMCEKAEVWGREG
jgi:hypothetical protein